MLTWTISLFNRVVLSYHVHISVLHMSLFFKKYNQLFSASQSSSISLNCISTVIILTLPIGSIDTSCSSFTRQTKSTRNTNISSSCRIFLAINFLKTNRSNYHPFNRYNIFCILYKPSCRWIECWFGSRGIRTCRYKFWVTTFHNSNLRFKSVSNELDNQGSRACKETHSQLAECQKSRQTILDDADG